MPRAIAILTMGWGWATLGRIFQLPQERQLHKIHEKREQGLTRARLCCESDKNKERQVAWKSL
jgi:hypothetical protein